MSAGGLGALLSEAWCPSLQHGKECPAARGLRGKREPSPKAML